MAVFRLNSFISCVAAQLQVGDIAELRNAADTMPFLIIGEPTENGVERELIPLKGQNAFSYQAGTFPDRGGRQYSIIRRELLVQVEGLPEPIANPTAGCLFVGDSGLELFVSRFPVGGRQAGFDSHWTVSLTNFLLNRTSQDSDVTRKLGFIAWSIGVQSDDEKFLPLATLPHRQ